MRNRDLKLDLSADIIPIDFDVMQYLKEEQTKTQIVLHHSAGWDNARGMFAGWLADKTRVATCCGIDDKGKIYQAFGSQYWAWHVNIRSTGNRAVYRDPKFASYCDIKNARDVEMRTIGVEICNWGPLTFKKGKFYSWAGIVIPEEKVIEHEYRGFNAWEKYTDDEINALYKLLKYWGERYSIPLGYRENIWEVSEDALMGIPGVYTHGSYRIDKTDIHPQSEMIQMLMEL